MEWFRSLGTSVRKPRVSIGHMDAKSVMYGVFCPRGLQTNIGLSDFTFCRALGCGYASTVFEALHKGSNTPCVIKVAMKLRLMPEEEQRIRREIKIHSRINHPNILTFYASFEDASAFYLVLEYAPKGDLFSFVRKERKMGIVMSEQRLVTTILHPILRAVGYLHQHSILHRDIKPENVLLDAKGNLRLCDFGMAIEYSHERPRSNVGTLEYMPPEIIQKKVDTYCEKMDVWAIGVLLYECLVGTSPFTANSEEEVARKIVSLDYKIPVAASADLCDFFRQTLKVDPQQRPSVPELLEHPLLQKHLPTSSSAKPKEDSVQLSGYSI